MKRIVAIPQRPRIARDTEFLGRNRVYLGLLEFLGTLDNAIIDFHRRLAGGGLYLALGLGDDLNVRIGHDDVIDILGLVVIGLAFLLGLFLPIDLHDAHLGKQRVLDEAVKDQKAG